MANYSCKKFFSSDLMLSHNTSVTDDGRTDDRRQPYHKLDCYLSTVGSSSSVGLHVCIISCTSCSQKLTYNHKKNVTHSKSTMFQLRLLFIFVYLILTF